MIRRVNGSEPYTSDKYAIKNNKLKTIQSKSIKKQEQQQDAFKRSEEEKRQRQEELLKRQKQIELLQKNALQKLISGIAAMSIAAGAILYQTIPDKDDKEKKYDYKPLPFSDTAKTYYSNINFTENNAVYVSNEAKTLPDSVEENPIVQSEEINPAESQENEAIEQNNETDNSITEEVTEEVEPQQEEYTSYPQILPEGTFSGILEGKEAVVEELCNQYNVEPRFIAALIGAETGWGSTGVSDINNPMSYRASGDLGKDSRGFGIFSTPELGLEAGIRNISEYTERYGIGAIDIDHIEEIGIIYCGEDYENWVSLIRGCYERVR